MKPELPVRSAVPKHCTGGLVVRWVTTSEYPLLYVFVFLLSCLTLTAASTAALIMASRKSLMLPAQDYAVELLHQYLT